MEFLGIGPLELIFIFIIIILVLGPKDMEKAGKSVGNFLNTLWKSETWKSLRTLGKYMRNLPNQLAREAELDKLDLIGNENVIGNPPTSHPYEAPNNIPQASGFKEWITPSEIHIDTPSEGTGEISENKEAEG